MYLNIHPVILIATPSLLNFASFKRALKFTETEDKIEMRCTFFLCSNSKSERSTDDSSFPGQAFIGSTNQSGPIFHRFEDNKFSAEHPCDNKSAEFDLPLQCFQD